MPENRYFVEEPLKKGQTLSLPAEEMRHLRVMRKEVGDEVELVNGRNQIASAQITHLDRKIATLHLNDVSTSPPKKRQIILAQALLKPNLLDLVIEKGTELGCTSFWLFEGDRSDKKGLSANQSQRLKHLTISALKQCGRLDLPTIVYKPPLCQWEKPAENLYFGDSDSKKYLTPSESDTIIVIGPESGFSEAEILKLKSLGAIGVCLSSHILRAETAAICALAQMANCKTK